MKNNMQNIIIVGHDKITEQIQKEEIELIFQKKELHLKILKDCTLTLEVEERKEFILIFEVKENIQVNLLFFKKGQNSTYQEKYILKSHSKLTINKICMTKEIKEDASVFLEGEGASINYVCKTVAVSDEKYKIDIFHHAKDTSCLLYNHGITHLEGSISFLVTNKVPKKIKYAKISQNSQIITLNNKKSEIKPNLFIEENEVEASHAAHIGPLEEESLFYLQSRGISKKEACKLLLKGFLVQKMSLKEERLTQIIDTYWR